jgi:hypothetical protein
VFAAGALVWTGSTAVIGIGVTSGSFAAGVALWTGSTAIVELAPQPMGIIPQNLSLVEKGANYVTMSWQGVWGATGYDIRRDGVVVAVNHAETQYTDSGLIVGTEYNHEVRAVFT